MRLGPRAKLLLIALVLIAPIVASFIAYFVVRPAGTSNYGELLMPPATVTLTRASHDRPPLAALCVRGVCWGSPGAWNPPAPKPLSKNNLTGIFP